MKTSEQREVQIQEASEKISEVLNTVISWDGLSVYDFMCSTLGVEPDNDSEVWREIEIFMAQKIIEMSVANLLPCEMCGETLMTKEEHDFSDICPECLEGDEDEDDTDIY